MSRPDEIWLDEPIDEREKYVEFIQKKKGIIYHDFLRKENVSEPAEETEEVTPE